VRAVEALRAEGVPARLDLLERMRRREVATRIRSADVVVDQLLLGWYGGVAVEAMAMAKPVICFIAEPENPFGERLPILRADPATLADRLRSLVADRRLLHRAGLAGRSFVEAEHNPIELARQVLDGLVDLPRPVSPAAAPAR